MTAFESDIVGVSVERLGDAESVQSKEACQRMVSCSGESGLDEEGAEFVAVQPVHGGLLTEPGSSDVGSRVVGEEFFLHAVPVETRRG